MGYDQLPVMAEHAAAAEGLPPHQRDPFDRRLIAQAQTEPMHRLTRDPVVALYRGNLVRV